MKRLHIVAEGQTEESFVRRTLVDQLGLFQVSADVRCVLTSKDKHRKDISYRGGMTNYAKAKNDILQWIKEEKNNKDVYFTTMFDYYALPDDFPGYSDAQKQVDPYKRVGMIEKAFAEDINDRRFIPYIQLHEFESLLFSSPQSFIIEFFDKPEGIIELEKILEEKHNPELINDGQETAPSKRIIKIFPTYADNKAAIGSMIAQEIGLEKLRQSCSHFGEWLSRLERLDHQPLGTSSSAT